MSPFSEMPMAANALRGDICVITRGAAVYCIEFFSG
jgi:hypothetical protein